jgi:hypothetical protein
MAHQMTRTPAELPWLSLLPPEQRADLELSYDDPDVAEWDALFAADRALETDFARSDARWRMAKPFAAAGLIAVMLLAVDTTSVAEQSGGTGGSSATASGTVTASPAVVAAQTAPEENRTALVSRPVVEVAGTTAAQPTRRKLRPKPAGDPSTTPPPTGEPAPPPLAPATLPVVGDVEVPAPKLEVPGVELPQLPHLQLPELPELPPLLPPSGQQ